MNKNSVTAISFGILIIYASLYLWQLAGDLTAFVNISNVLTVAFAVLATLYALRAAQTFESGELQRRAWLTFGLGMGLWAMAECIWFYYQSLLGQEVPFPSTADVLWALGYAPLFWGLFFQYRTLGNQSERRRQVMALALYATGAILTFILVLWPMLSEPGEASAVELFLDVLYPIGDLFLALIATLSLLVLGRSLLGLPWLYIACSMLLFALADLVYVYADWREIYEIGRNWLSGLSDVTYLAGYITAFIGAYRQATLTLSEL